MRYNLFLDEIDEIEERDEGVIIIRTFIPENSDEKKILIDNLTELIRKIQEKY